MYDIPIVEEKFISNLIVAGNDNWGAHGSKEYRKSYLLITNFHETNFSAAKYIYNSCDVKYSGKHNGKTKYQNILY